MPISPSHPGIFPEELSLDGHAIGAVPTSITAFVGRAARGPIDEPVALSDFADFARIFGELANGDSLGQAVKAFYDNGGAQAIAVRIARNAKAAKLERGALKLAASSEGSWGNQLRIRIRAGLDGMFHLQVRDGVTGRVETHPGLTFQDSPRRIDRVVNGCSQLVRWTADAPNPRTPILEHAREPAAGKTAWSDDAASTKVERSGRGSCGRELAPADFIGPGKQANHQGLYALERADLVNLLVIPRYRDGRDVGARLWRSAASYCRKRRAFLLVDPRADCMSRESARMFLERLGLRTPDAAIFFPGELSATRVRERGLEECLPSGAAAGCLARTDAQRGVWRAPAGLGAALCGVDDSRYVPVRRMALFLEESLRRGFDWVTFEPNDESLWAQMRESAAAFMQGFFRLGAFEGRTPRDAYFVKCDEETTLPRDVDQGVVNAVVGFAPLRPGEFVTLALRQLAGKAPP